MRLPNRPLSLLLALVAAQSSPFAQWDSIPWNGGTISYSNSFVLWPSTNGVWAFSAMGQRWTLISPPGSTVRGQGDSVIITEEPGGVLRGWSALRNDSATLALPPGSSVIHTAHTAVAWDHQSGGNALLFAYSPYLNAWTGFQTAKPAASVQPQLGVAAIAVNDGADYHAYSARTGAWTSLGMIGGNQPSTFGDQAHVDLGTGIGPKRIAAYSGHRGTWALSDLYPTTISKDLKFTSQLVSVRVRVDDPTRYAYSAFNARTGVWTTSSVTHAFPSSGATYATGDTILLIGNPTDATWEAFGASSGVWTGLTSANLALLGAGEDFAMVRDAANGDVYATSGVVPGGWSKAAIGGTATLDPTPERAGLVHAGSLDWAYCAAKNAWSAPVSVPSGASYAKGDAVFGFHATGSAPRAYSARFGEWVTASGVTAGTGDLTLGLYSALAFYDFQTGSLESIRAFDERMGRWAPPFSLSALGQYSAGAVGGSVLITVPGLFAPNGPVVAWSGHRGDWSATAGVGQPVSAVIAYGDIGFFRDSSQNLWAFGALERTHLAHDWPQRAEYQTSGPGPAGSALQKLRMSVRGQPGGEVMLLYASLGLAPAPYAVPGIGGLAYLDPAGAFLLGNLGVVDADGVLDLAIPLNGALPGGTSAWFQTIGVDLGTLQASFAGRAAQGWVL